MRPLDLIVIAAYLAGLVAIGLRFARRQRTTEQYFVAGRSVPGWAMGLSLLATIITSVTFIAYPGAAYAGWIVERRRTHIFALQVGETP